ncbi:ABC transporter ATP-binding protein [Acidaminobacter sp. JC074]|uniref:ABC transporter ATP-binding protein n=1 Tax=Acidaminobacter sp. JC074 TaxID=2530199 RepID=UPI001F10C1CA|nr:ABC transporter ATP-binding protein [Acidaminobacter sp. JC074]MCH4886561.1 ABC transporter ATP-binding protein [Acidaminobacter sp. JC074]
MLVAKNIDVRIRTNKILSDVSLEINEGKIYAIIGPNGSGKTTLLRALTRNVKVSSGQVLLHNHLINKMSSKKVAQTMAVLTQTHSGMNDVTVKELVGYGRFSHKEWYKGKNSEDSMIISECISKAGLESLTDRKISTLSGGERQRAWIAMALAQKPDLLVLDEPTTFLDIAHQLEIMELITDLNKSEGLTILMVLHDINHAARYSDHVFVIKEGHLYQEGTPWEILNASTLEKVFNVTAVVKSDEVSKKPIFYPKSVIKRSSIN